MRDPKTKLLLIPLCLLKLLPLIKISKLLYLYLTSGESSSALLSVARLPVCSYVSKRLTFYNSSPESLDQFKSNAGKNKEILATHFSKGS